MAMVLILATGCKEDEPEQKPETPEIPEKYKDFYNYPNGRKDPSGTLQITNSVNSPALLFTNDVTPANYIGTVDSLSSIKVNLPEQKFYTIVAVDKKNWEERSDQAERFSDLTYYSRTQPYSMTVHPNSMYGGGKWIINNTTNYWVSFKKSDGSGEIYAVAAPNTARVIIPIQFNKAYDYIPHFYRELKYDGVVIALAESDDIRSANTVYVTTNSPSFNTDIGVNITSPSANIKPAVFVTNGFNTYSFRVYFGQNNQLSNGAVDDFVLTSGNSSIFTGLNEDANVNQINFYTIALGRLYVKQDISMKKNKVYKINLSGSNENNYSTTTVESDAEDFYGDN